MSYQLVTPEELGYSSENLRAQAMSSLIVTCDENYRPSTSMLPEYGSSRIFSSSIPVCCNPHDKSKVVCVVPFDTYIDMFTGVVTVHFNKKDTRLYEYENLSLPLSVRPMNSTNQPHSKVHIEEITLDGALATNKMFRNMFSTHNKMSFTKEGRTNNPNKSHVYIDKQLTFPNASQDHNILYLLSDTVACGTRAKWALETHTDSFKGSVHLYLACVCPKQSDSKDFMRNLYFYIQVKRKAYCEENDLIVCTSQLLNITATDYSYYYQSEEDGD